QGPTRPHARRHRRPQGGDVMRSTRTRLARTIAFIVAAVLAAVLATALSTRSSGDSGTLHVTGRLQSVPAASSRVTIALKHGATPAQMRSLAYRVAGDPDAVSVTVAAQDSPKLIVVLRPGAGKDARRRIETNAR